MTEEWTSSTLYVPAALGASATAGAGATLPPSPFIATLTETRAATTPTAPIPTNFASFIDVISFALAPPQLPPDPAHRSAVVRNLELPPGLGGSAKMRLRRLVKVREG